MVTVIQSNGTIIKTQPDRVYQGSNNVNQVVLVGAFAQNLIPQIAFKLPQTGTYTAFDFMTSADIPTGTGLSAWTYDIPLAVTQEYGQVDFQIQVEDINGNIVASGLCSFEVERGVPPDTSSIPDLEPLETIKQIIQSIQGDIANGWLMSKGILPYDLTFEYPLNAIVFDPNSKNMFLSLQANNKGNALSDSAYWQDLGTYTGLKSQITANGQLIAQNTQNITANTQAIEQLQEDVASIESFEIQIVSELPATGKSNIMYLVPIPNETAYDEYVWIESEQKFELIGTTRVDLSDYYTKGQTDILLSAKANQTDLQVLQTTVGENSSAITDLQSSVETLSQGLSTAESNITTLQGEVTTNTEDIAINTSDIDNINQELPNKADVSTVTNLQSQVNAISDIAESSVLFTPQTLTAEQQAQVRANIGAGSSGFSGSYDDLGQKPIINADLDALSPTSAISNQLYRHIGTSATTYKIGMLYLVVGSAWQEYIPTQASQVGALATTDVLNSPSQSTTQTYSAKYVQDNFAPRTFIENLYLTKTGDTTALLTDDKPTASDTNYLSTTTTNTSFNFETPDIVVTRVLENEVQFDKQDSMKVTLSVAFSRDASVEFGANLSIGSTVLSSNQAFGLSGSYQATDTGSGDVNVYDITFNIVMDKLTEVTTFPIGETLTLNIYKRQDTATSLTTGYICGVNVEGAVRTSYVNLNFTATSIDTSQIADGAITTSKISDGAITTSKISDGAVTDAKIDSVSGTKVSGVVRTTQQTLTDTEKQQAQTNTTHTATQNHANSGVQPGWYQVANLKTNGNYDIKIKQAYNYNFPESIHLSISINNRLSTVEPFASITQLSGINPAAFALSKIRVRQGTDGGTTFLDVYNPDQLWNTTWVDITSDSQDVVVEPNSPFQFIGTEDNPSGYKVSSLDLVTGFNTSYLRANTATISGTVSNLNTISQPVNSVVTYSFSSGCANAPITDSGMVIQMQESTSYCTQLVIANDENASTWRRSYRDGTWTEWTKVGTFLPYEFNKQISFGGSGYLYIGKFPIYDTNITVDISSTTSTTYSGKLVIACQNYAVLKASVFGDYSNTVTPNIYYKKVDNTVEIYFKPTAWSKNVIHITGCGIRGEVTHVCEKIDTVTSDATLQPENEYVESVESGRTELIYDMDSTDASINHGFTSGMKGGNYLQMDFSQYKKIRIYARLYTSNCVQEIPVKNRKVAQTAMVVTGSNPIIISSLNILFTIEPLLNRLQVGAYGKYTFSSTEGTFTLESGASNDNFYVYRIEGIV